MHPRIFLSVIIASEGCLQKDFLHLIKALEKIKIKSNVRDGLLSVFCHLKQFYKSYMKVLGYLGQTVTEKRTSVMSYVWIMLETEGKRKPYFCSYSLTNLTYYYQFYFYFFSKTKVNQQIKCTSFCFYYNIYFPSLCVSLFS